MSAENKTTKDLGKRLQGKVAFITGASAGIGKATALRFAREGAKVALFSRTKAKLDAVVEEIKKLGGEALAIVGDVTKAADLKSAVETTVSHFGALHIAFNNAGAYSGGVKIGQEDKQSTAEERYDNMFDTNTKSIFLAMEYEIPALKKSGGGSIINNTSTMSIHVTSAFSGAALYSASKAAVDMFTKYAAMENAADNIRVNSVNPGVTITEIMGPQAAEENYHNFAKHVHLFQRAAAADEIASTVAFLASDDASFVTGTTLLVDGGATVK